jgi:hypothetical protein
MLLKRLQIRAQAILAVVSILGLLKFGLRLHWLSESIPGLLKRLQIRTQATLAVGIDSWAPLTFKNLGSECTVILYIA